MLKNLKPIIAQFDYAVIARYANTSLQGKEYFPNRKIKQKNVETADSEAELILEFSR
jgi:hypothetical protein